MSGRNDLAQGRLSQLGEVFSVAEMAAALDMERFDAVRYLRAWRLRGLVEPLGGRSAIYLNLVRVPDAGQREALWERALLKAMPSAIVSCVELLGHHGDEARTALRRLVLVSEAEEFYEIDGAVVLRRPAQWLAQLRQFGLAPVHPGGLPTPRLRPGAALADLARHDSRPIGLEDALRQLDDRGEVSLFVELAPSTGDDRIVDLDASR